MEINSHLLSSVNFFRNSTLVEQIDSSLARFSYRGELDAPYILDLISAGVLSKCQGSKTDYVFNGIVGVFYNIEDFLYKGERRIKPPNAFYVVDKDWYFDSLAKDELSLKYQAVIELLTVLEEVSDYQERKFNDIKLIVLCGKKLIISSNYSYEQMRCVDVEKIRELKEEFISSDTHSDKKKDILKSVFIELYADDECISLGDIATSLPKILSRLSHGYDLFVAEFSYEKIKSEAERDKLEFNTRLNKVFSDIQNQLLAIPAALLLVGSQLKVTDETGSELGNFSIWLGVIVFSILMEILIRNQKNTLEAVYREINIQEQMFKEKQLDIYPKFKKIYEALEDRFIHQCRLLWVIRILVAIILGVTTYIFLLHSFELSLIESFLIGAFFFLFYVLTAFLVDGGKYYQRYDE